MRYQFLVTLEGNSKRVMDSAFTLAVTRDEIISNLENVWPYHHITVTHVPERKIDGYLPSRHPRKRKEMT
jgi:hypothetical protein